MILVILYIFSMAIAFNMEINSISLPYFLKYGIAIVWIIISLCKRKGSISGTSYRLVKLLSTPFLFALIYTLILWMIDRPEEVNSSYVIHLFSTVLMHMIIVTCVVLVSELFGGQMIQLTFYGLVAAIVLNAIVVIASYGWTPWLEYCTHVFIADSYTYGSTLSEISYAMEVHDATFAMGLYIIYYMFYEEKEAKWRKLNLFLALMGSYLGFKRLGFFALIIASMVSIFVLRKKSKKFLRQNQLLGIVAIVATLAFVVIMKFLSNTQVFYLLMDSARQNLYKFLQSLYNVSLFYLGKGFSYVNKHLGLEDRLLGTSHSDLIRIYIEMGFCSFVAWVWYYFTYIPKKLYKKYNPCAGKFFLIATIYVFLTYTIDNTLTLFANQYVYYALPVGLIALQERQMLGDEAKDSRLKIRIRRWG